MSVSPAGAGALAVCRARLPEVSRTFALTIPELPDPLADSVTVAYLLCRVADTIEDDPRLGAAQRHRLFAGFRRVLEGAEPEELRRAWPVPDPLVDDFPAIVVAFRGLPTGYHAPITACLREMVDGMEAAGAAVGDAGGHVCRDAAELEQYCHYVAGTVGILLTRLFDTAVGGGFGGPAREAQGRRFGLGLQLTNILRDHPGDFARGTCFLPPAWLDGGRVAGPAVCAGVSLALGHLDAAQAYVAALPPDAAGIRRFCLWSSWMAVATLREVALHPHDEPRIPADEVADIIRFTSLHASDDATLAAQYATLRTGTMQALAVRMGAA